MVGAALIGGAASMSAAGTQADAATEAAGLQRDATLASIAEQRRQFEQTREDFAPYRELGATALGEYGALYGIGRNGLIPVNRGDVPPDVAQFEDRQVPTGHRYALLKTSRRHPCRIFSYHSSGLPSHM